MTHQNDVTLSQEWEGKILQMYIFYFLQSFFPFTELKKKTVKILQQKYLCNTSLELDLRGYKITRKRSGLRRNIKMTVKIYSETNSGKIFINKTSEKRTEEMLQQNKNRIRIIPVLLNTLEKEENVLTSKIRPYSVSNLF